MNFVAFEYRCLLAFFFLALPVHSATRVQSIRIVGNAAFTSRELAELMSLKPGQLFTESALTSDRQAIGESYRIKGFLSAHVDSVEREYTNDSALVTLTLSVVEGRRAVISVLSIAGVREISETDALALFDTKPGNPLDEAVLELDIDILLSRCEKLGYPFAQCRLVDVTPQRGEEVDSLHVFLEVNEGQRVTIDEVRVEGNRETHPDVVTRETRLSSGEVFNPVKVDAIRQRLRRLNIFSDVAEPELYLRKEKGGILIKVSEGNTNTFDGVIGYIPETATGQRGYVTGLASVSMRNLFGTGRKLSFRWAREDRFSQELGFRYLEPWVFSFPANLGGGFFQRQQDSSYVRRVIDVKAELMLSEVLSVSALVGSESVIPSADSTINRVFRSSTVTVGAEIQYDTRDDIVSATSGVYYRTDYQYGRKRISNVPSGFAGVVIGSTTLQKFALDFNVFLPTLRQQVVALGVHGRQIQGGRVEESDMFRFGGARTLRGYREAQFLGSRVAWSNMEYRFTVARRSFFFGFFDTGYYYRPSDDARMIEQSEAFKFGYGIGIQLETGLGMLGVSFALGQGDSFSQGKIHFGLINEF